MASAGTGLFRPPSMERELIAMPGAVGGANRGNTAADPDRGIVYITTQDYPSVYLPLKEEPPFASATPVVMALTNSTTGIISKTQAAGADAVYMQYCMACHGPDLAGRPNIPPLANVGKRLSFVDFEYAGRGGEGRDARLSAYRATRVTGPLHLCRRDDNGIQFAF